MKLAARMTFLAGLYTALGVAGAATGMLCMTGCSPRPQATGPVAQDSGGLHVVLTTDPSPLRVGDNTLIVTLTGQATSAPVVDANVTVTAYNQLAGGGDTETGRSQGNGVYNVPVKLPISDQYTASVTVQRLGKPDVTVKFPLDTG
jgi:hypothetical protein